MSDTVPEKEYSGLKKAFPNEFIYFFDYQNKLNAFGKIAQELLECRESAK